MDLTFLGQQPFTGILDNLVLTVITVVISLLVAAVRAEYDSRTTASQRSLISTIAFQAVQAAEQVALAQGIDPSAKKQYAMNFIAHELDSLGLTLTPTQIDNAVESAVYSAFNYGKQTGQPTEAPAAAVAS